MFDRFRRSWDLLREAWNVLRLDRELVLFPIFSGICSLIVLASFAVPAVLIGIASATHGGHLATGDSFENGRFHPGVIHYAGMFLFYLATYFVVLFFNTGLVACVRTRFAGGTPSFQEGLRFSMTHIGRIFQWALVSATVGTVLKAVQERAGWIGRIVIGLLGIAWTLATTFVVPVLVYERVGPIEAVKRSTAAFRRTWGETVVVNFGMSTAFGLLALAGIVPLLLGIFLGVALIGTSQALGLAVIIGAFLLTVIYWIGLSIIQAALQGIFLTACYEYATTGRVPSVFTPDHVIAAWQPKAAGSK